MMRVGRKPGMVDVGRLAGVSHQTVSRVVNGSRHVRPETRRKVLAAMQELGFRPNPLARGLATGRSNTLGVVSFDTTLFGPASTLLGIERAAHEDGYFIVIVSLKALNRTSVSDAVQRLSLQGVDGILVIAPLRSASEALADAPDGLPLVAVEAGAGDSVPVVEVDQFAGASAATRHLLDLGHRTVWHVAGPPDFLESEARVAGWRQTLEAARSVPPPVLVGDWTPRAGYDLGRRLAADQDVTAVFVANDQMALGVLRAMHEANRAIPREVSIVGFDDIPEAEYFLPPLTTVRQDFDEIGARSLQLLVRQIQTGRRLPSAPRVAPRLVVRASTAMPPLGHQ
jgi:DNA-binding LacI/PurR family transcriptional regulator